MELEQGLSPLDPTLHLRGDLGIQNSQRSLVFAVSLIKVEMGPQNDSSPVGSADFLQRLEKFHGIRDLPSGCLVVPVVHYFVILANH